MTYIKVIEREKKNENNRIIRSEFGACSKALENLGIDFDIVDAVEIDKYAIKSFNAVHGTAFEPQDICSWDKDFKDIDLIMGGFPLPIIQFSW